MSRFSRALAISTMPVVKSDWDKVFLKNLEMGFDDDNVLDMPYKKSELVYICISSTSRAISQVPIQILQPARGRGSEKVKRAQDFKNTILLNRVDLDSEKKIVGLIKAGELEPVKPDNPYQMLLMTPNPLMDGNQLKEALITFLMLDGNVWLFPFPMGNVQPMALWVLPKRNIEPVSKETALDYWWYKSGEGKKKAQIYPDEIMHTKLYNPYDNVMGLSPLEAGKIAVRTDFKASVFNEKFFENGAVPEGILHTEFRLGDSLFKRVKEQFENRHQGYKRARRIAVLEKGLKYERMGLTHEDMKFIDLRKYDRETILQVYGMKKVILSVTEDVNHATAKQQRKSWWQDTNIPMMKSLTSAMNFGFLQNTPYIARWDISTIEALHEDYNSKVDTGYKLWQMGFTANEVNERLELGFDPKPWRDLAYAPVNLVPVTIGAPRPENGGQEPEKESVLYDKFPKHVVGLLENKIDEKEQELGIVIWKSLIDNITPIERMFESKVSRVFFEMRKLVIEELNKEKLNNILLMEFHSEKELLLKKTESLFYELIKIGISSMALELDKSSKGLIDELAYIFLSRKKLKLVGVIDTVKKRIRKHLLIGIEENESIDQIAQRLKNQFNISTVGAKKIARTETIGAVNFARNQELIISQIQYKKWFTAKDERVRDDHNEMHNKVILANENWIVGGASLAYPGDPNGPPEQIIHCRCIELPVRKRRQRTLQN